MQQAKQAPRPTQASLDDEAARADLAAHEFDRGWVARHIAEERQRAAFLGEIREAVFGAQDGLVSTLAVVSTVAGATAGRLPDPRFPILVAGIASALAGVFSMAAGEYLSSKSQREIFEAQIAGERDEVAERPGEAQAEVAYMLEEDGIPRDDAARVAAVMARHPEAMLKTMVQKELGLGLEVGEASPRIGALVMGIAFGLGAIVPVIPHMVLPVSVAVFVSVIATAGVLFGIGVVKSRWTARGWLRSGLEILGIGAAAGIVGYFFGDILPTLLGTPAVS